MAPRDTLAQRLRAALGQTAGDDMVDWISATDADRRAIRSELRADIAELRQHMEGRLGNLESKVDAQSAIMTAKFEAVDRRFEAVDQRFDSLMAMLDARFDSLMATLDARFEATDAKIKAAGAEGAEKLHEIHRAMLYAWALTFTAFLGAVFGAISLLR